MKTPEDEAFDELARKQGAWGGGFKAKQAMAADKYSDIVSDGGLDPRNKMDAQPAHCQCTACKDGVIHASDCAVHNGPAYPAGPCDCGVAQELDYKVALNEWLDKTEWVQEKINSGHLGARYLGMHRADVLRDLAYQNTVTGKAPAQPADNPYGYDWSMLEAAQESLREHMARIKELEAQLAQPSQGHVAVVEFEPVIQGHEVWFPARCIASEIPTGTKLYTKPPKREWVGLTDEDWKEIEDMPDTFDQGVAWAQAKLKEKNT